MYFSIEVSHSSSEGTSSLSLDRSCLEDSLLRPREGLDEPGALQGPGLNEHVPDDDDNCGDRLRPLLMW